MKRWTLALFLILPQVVWAAIQPGTDTRACDPLFGIAGMTVLLTALLVTLERIILR